MFSLQKTNRLCRKYDLDLWNKVLFSDKLSNLSLFFIKKRRARQDMSKNFSTFLRVDLSRTMTRRKRISSFGKLLETRKKLCFFYGGLNKAAYRRLNHRAFNMSGSYSENMLLLLESRLCVVVHRMNFSNTIMGSIHLILSGNILVNKEVIVNPNHIVRLGDIIEVNPCLKKLIFTNMISILPKRATLLLKFYEINYNALCGMLIKRPKLKEVPFSFRLSDKFFFSEYIGKF